MNCKLHGAYKGIRPPTTPEVTKHNCSCRLLYTLNHWEDGISAIAQALGVSTESVKNYGKKLGLGKPPRVYEDIDQEVLNEVKELSEKTDSRSAKKRDKALLTRIAELQRENEALLQLSGVRDTYTIKPNGTPTSESTAVIVASDWHIEEVVKHSQTNHLNEFNEKVCQERITRFWRHAVKLIKKEQKGSILENAVLFLGGDFISGSIHDDLAESNRLSPIDAILEAEKHLVAGINYLLKETDLKEIVVVCASGNHGRTTAKQRISTEQGNSLERFMYAHIANHFASEERLTFVINEGYHTYLDVMGWTIRFHHGHNIKYGGGIGGITIPVNKAIAGWDKGRQADYDVFGHYHQFFDGGQFICNGSLIGYNAFAVSIKASYEPPRQAFFLIDKDDGKTVVCPVVLERDK